MGLAAGRHMSESDQFVVRVTQKGSRMSSKSMHLQPPSAETINFQETQHSRNLTLKQSCNCSYFPVNYEPLLQCTWLVEGLEDQVVTLTFTRLQLEAPGVNDTTPCPHDRVEVGRCIVTYFLFNIPTFHPCTLITATIQQYSLYCSALRKYHLDKTATSQLPSSNRGASRAVIFNLLKVTCL